MSECTTARSRQARTTSDTTVYDPTCGSGSLLLKVADEARGPVTLYFTCYPTSCR